MIDSFSSWIDLTSRQRSIWLDVSASGDSRLFQVGVLVKIQQELDLEVLERALADFALRHDALRLIIDSQQPRQRIGRSPAIPLTVVDFSTEADPDAAVQAHVDELFASPFNLDDALFQVIAAQFERGRYYLILRVQHIVTDAVALSRSFKDIIATYNSLASGISDERPCSSYRHFQEQDAAYSASPRFKRDLEYWQTRLRGLPESILARRSGAGDNTAARPLVRREIDVSRYQRFLSQCDAHDIRPANTLFALGAWLLGSARGRHELVLGVAYPGRTKEDRHTLGMFSGVMPLRLKMAGESSLPQLSTLLTQCITRDYLHHRVSIDDISRAVSAEQRHRRRLVDLMISYIPRDVADLETELLGERLRATPLRGTEANPFAIYISDLDGRQSITVDFAYDRRYLSDGQVSFLADQFVRLFDAFIESPQARLRPVDGLTDGPIDETQAAVSAYLPEADHQVRVVSTFTSLPIADSLRFWLRRTGIDASLDFAGYNQLFQELLDPASATRRNRRGANLALLRVEDWLREQPAEASSREDRTRFLEKISDDLVAAFREAAPKSHVPYVLLICAPSPKWDFGGPWASVQERLLEKLVTGLRGVRGLTIATYHELRNLYPTDAEYDGTSDQLGHIPYTTSAFTAMGTLAARHIHLALRSPIKAIVVDCDNTLWDGVVGEDGPQGVRILDSHRRLQQRLVEAARCGVLICLCSKNIEDDVASVLNQRSDMVLKPEHIVGYKVNWNAKSENIKELANELGLGLDSFLFLDDNPVEVAEVAAACPQVQSLTVDLAHAAGTQIDHLWPLDCVAATAEDAKRVESYRSNLSRKRERARSSDFASFIEGLNLQLDIERPSDGNISRLAQLTERTNQFNINNIKRSGVELAEQNASGNGAVLAFRVADKFGDYGIVGLLAVHLESDELLVDTFLMSCRVLGRGVEHRMVSEIGRLAVEHGAASIRIPVRVTNRNLPVRRFLETVGGEHLTQGNDQLHVITTQTAAEFSFRPDAHVESDEDDADAGAPTGLVGRADAAIWAEAATAFASVAQVEMAVQAAGGERRSIKISRSTQTQTEKVLEEIFCHALGLTAVGADDDFFDLGVHSLMAVQLVSRIRDRLQSQISIRALFESSTIARLASAIEQQSTSGYQPLVPLQIGDERPALFCCHPANGDAVCYMRLTKAIGSDQTVYGFEASGLSPGEPMARSLHEMAQTYIKEMISVQPKGPYHLLGWSFGGVLAFEIARQIHAAGGQVGFLGMMDAVAPEKGPLPEEQHRLDEIDEAAFLEAVGQELNNHRRYGKLPLLDVEGLTWQHVIDGFQSLGVVPKDYSFEEMRRKMLVYANCGLLTSRYRPPALPIPVVHFQASENPQEEWDFDWSRYTTSGVRTIWIRCHHYRMGFEPNTTLIGAHLRALVRGDRTVLGWWQRTSLANRVNDVIGRLALKRA